MHRVYVKKHWLVLYLVFFYGFFVIFFLRVKQYSKFNFSPQKLNLLLDSKYNNSESVDNLCLYHIMGEPTDSGNLYVKIALMCKDGESVNTLSLKSVNDLSWKNVLSVLARANRFNPDVIFNSEKGWKCYRDGVQINENDLIEAKNQITCYEKN